ncbi:MAG: amidohydrolase family protein, partial [Pseudomonadota bacterium]
IEDPASAQRALLSGVTTTRVLGDNYLKGMATRDLVRAGHVPGPQMLVSGGHVRPRLGEPFILSYPQFGQYLDAPLQGPDKVAAVVRAVIARGADVIKVGASERAGLARTDPRRPELSHEELSAAVAAAREAGLYVAAHAHDRHGANAAVRAGVRSIEHGSYLDAEGIRLMREHGTWLVADVYNGTYIAQVGRRDGWPAEILRKNDETTGTQRAGFREAVKAGVRVGFGTDAGVFPHGLNARQFAFMVEHGMTPAQAIRAATVDAARALGREGEFGVIREGLAADLIAVRGDPLADVRRLEDVRAGIARGRVAVPLRHGDVAR